MASGQSAAPALLLQGDIPAARARLAQEPAPARASSRHGPVLSHPTPAQDHAAEILTGPFSRPRAWVAGAPEADTRRSLLEDMPRHRELALERLRAQADARPSPTHQRS
jgi:hypothetical protein